MQQTVSSIDRDKLGAELAQLETLGLNELRARWRQLYDTAPPPRFSRDLLGAPSPIGCRSSCSAD